jgi:hypothetical protein
MTAQQIITRACARCGRQIHWVEGRWVAAGGVPLVVTSCAIDPFSRLLCSPACKASYCEAHQFEQDKPPEDQVSAVVTRMCPVCSRWMYQYAESFWRSQTGGRLAVRMCEQGDQAVVLCSQPCKVKFCAGHPGLR